MRKHSTEDIPTTQPANPPCAVPCVGSEPWAGNYFVATYPPFSTWTKEQVPAVTDLLTRAAEQPEHPIGLYVHLPFCAHRCDYCYYLSYDDKTAQQQERYVDALIGELSIYAESAYLSERSLEFVYLGGGTPSLLSAVRIERLLRRMQKIMPWDNLQEGTIECGPCSITKSKLQVMKDFGITRISMGVQSLDDDVLVKNGRRHLCADVQQAYKAIEEVGFAVVNIDLIVGLMGQTDDTFRRTLDCVIAMAPDSVTIYQLEHPHNTPMYRALKCAPSDDGAAGWDVKRARLTYGFHHLEQAGYSVRSAYSAVRDPEHNLFTYQEAQYKGADLLGIGAASFSFLSGVHFQNCTSFDAYLHDIAAGRLPIERAHQLSHEERMVREFVLQLKLGGVNAAYFHEKFDVDVLDRFVKPLDKCRRGGWLSYDSQGVELTRDGLVRVDRLIPSFYLPAHSDVRYC